jgi:hypothetical protein
LRSTEISDTITSLAELDAFLDSEEANYGLTDQARQLVIFSFGLFVEVTWFFSSRLFRFNLLP